MKNRAAEKPRSRRAVWVLSALLCSQALCLPLAAEEQGFWTRHRAWGVAFLSGGLYMAKRGYDFKTDGDDIYKEYKRANTDAEADRLFDKANDQDIKSQISWGVAAALTVSAARLLLFNPEPDRYTGPRKAEQKSTDGNAAPTGVRLVPQLETNRWGVQLQRKFF